MKIFHLASFCAFALALTSNASSAEGRAAPDQANEPHFIFEFIKSAKGEFIDRAVGVNDAGEVAGTIGYNDNPNASRAVVWKDGSITDISVLPHSTFNVSAINQSGELAGVLVFQPGVYGGEHAAVWKKFGFTDLDSHESRKGYDSNATGLNTKGQAVGWSFSEGSDPTATLWDKGTVIELGVSSKKEGHSEAHAINDAGQIVGRVDERAQTKTGRKRVESDAVLWLGSVVTILPTIGGRSASADAINERGQIVGWSEIRESTGYGFSSAAHGTLWDDGRAIDLGGLRGFRRTSALAINNSGQIVGSADNPQIGGGSPDPSDHHALYWDSKKRMVDLNQYVPRSLSEAGWILTEAIGINDDGAIVGTASNGQQTRAFLLIPTKP